MSNKEAKKSKGGFLLWIVLFIVFIGVGFAVKMLIPSPISSDVEIDVDTLKAEIKQINELATMQYDYREIVQNEEKKAFSKKKATTLIATFDGTIKAGIDMDNVQYEVKNPDPETDEPPVINVKVPDAKILSHEDYNHNTVYEEGNAKAKKRNNLIKEKKKEKQRQFIKDGNLDEAKAQAEDAISDFIHDAYGEDVVVNFEDEK